MQSSSGLRSISPARAVTPARHGGPHPGDLPLASPATPGYVRAGLGGGGGGDSPPNLDAGPARGAGGGGGAGAGGERPDAKVSTDMVHSILDTQVAKWSVASAAASSAATAATRDPLSPDIRSPQSVGGGGGGAAGAPRAKRLMTPQPTPDEPADPVAQGFRAGAASVPSSVSTQPLPFSVTSTTATTTTTAPAPRRGTAAAAAAAPSSLLQHRPHPSQLTDTEAPVFGPEGVTDPDHYALEGVAPPRQPSRLREPSYAQQQPSGPRSALRQARRASPSPAPTPQSSSAGAGCNYCAACGAEVAARRDRFCRCCGADLHQPPDSGSTPPVSRTSEQRAAAAAAAGAAAGRAPSTSRSPSPNQPASGSGGGARTVGNGVFPEAYSMPSAQRDAAGIEREAWALVREGDAPLSALEAALAAEREQPRAVRAVEGVYGAVLEMPNDNIPVVPVEAQNRRTAFWRHHPAAGVVSSLLALRGKVHDQHPELVNRHMTGPLLDAIARMMYGNYFLKYSSDSPTRERWCTLAMLSNLDSAGPLPYFCWAAHAESSGYKERYCLSELVGVQRDNLSPGFALNWINKDYVHSPSASNRKQPQLAKNCFTLWFLTPKGVHNIDLLNQHVWGCISESAI